MTDYQKQNLEKIFEQWPNLRHKVEEILENAKKIEFFHEDHSYIYNEKTRVISTTQLLQKHGITSGFAFVDKKVLQEASERGTIIHDEIETYIKTGKKGNTLEFYDAIRILEEEGLAPILSEFRIGNDIVAGTVDLLCVDNEGRLRIADFKTGVFHKKAFSWQTGIYNVVGNLGVEGDAICIHLPKTETRRARPVSLISESEINLLLDKERKGEIYEASKGETFEVSVSLLEEVADVSKKLGSYKAIIKELEEQEKKFKQELYSLMLDQNILSYTSEEYGISISRKDAYDRTGVDTKRLKEELPEIYKQYKTTTTVSGGVAITEVKTTKKSVKKADKPEDSGEDKFTFK